MKRKFVSKSQNLCVVLKAGLPANPLAGAPAIPGLSVRFQDGMVLVDEEIAEKLLNTQAFMDGEFLEVFEGEVDPYLKQRKETEPRHVIEELKYGQIEKAYGTPKRNEVKELIAEEAKKLAMQMLPEMVREVVLQLNKENKESSEKEGVEVETLNNDESATANDTTVKATKKKEAKK